ncbi:MAG TPA: tetratricopeptide repeat protein [Kofleriaceae bacterium]|nr:tetratricopeptide repeat protein [Kofleriaceae bacterium]
MQETFKSHIEARKKLVQEVVSKGSASAEVLDAAFSDPVTLASGSPVTPGSGGSNPGGDFSTKYRRVTPAAGIPVVTNAWADASSKTTVSTPPVHPMFDGGNQTTTDILPLPDEPGARPATRISPAADAGETVIQSPPIASPVQRAKAVALDVVDRAKAVWADKKKRPFVLGGAGAFLLLLIIIIAVAGGGGGKAAAKPHEGGGSGSAVVGTGDGSDRVIADNGSDTTGSATEPVGTGSDNGSAGSAATPDTGSGAGSSDVIEMPEDGSAAGSAVKPNNDNTHNTHNNANNTHNNNTHNNTITTPPPPKIDVKETVNEATMLYVKGDQKGALALLLKAKAANPVYAPTYRVMGNVYKKLGNNAAAKAAFEKYVRYAPKAPDVDTIKDEISKL